MTQQGTCPVCAVPLTQPPTGARRAYCSPACRQAAYRGRLAAREGRDGTQHRRPEAGAPIPEDQVTVYELSEPLRAYRLVSIYNRPWPPPDEMAAHLGRGMTERQRGASPGPGWHMRRLRETAEYLMAVRERLSDWVRYYEAEEASRPATARPKRPRRARVKQKAPA